METPPGFEGIRPDVLKALMDAIPQAKHNDEAKPCGIAYLSIEIDALSRKITVRGVMSCGVGEPLAVDPQTMHDLLHDVSHIALENMPTLKSGR